MFVGLICGVDERAGDTKHFRIAFRNGKSCLPQTVFIASVMLATLHLILIQSVQEFYSSINFIRNHAFKSDVSSER